VTATARELEEVHVGTRDLSQFLTVHDETRLAETFARAASLGQLIGDHTIWNVNSTAVGGGVAEMLQSILAFSRGLGIDARWLVINGSPEFFQLTKRIHHALHGQRGDGSPLGPAQHEIYEATLRENALDLCARVQPGDFVLLHDPQTAGLAPELMRLGARVIWRCHIGHDFTNTESDLGWGFLKPYIQDVPVFVFSKRSYAPSWCPADRVVIVQPSIDAFSAKNQDLDEDTVRSILVHTGLVEGPMPANASCRFARIDGTPGRVERHADIDRSGRAPAQSAPLIVQVSRWDPLKDMLGVMLGFERLVERAPDLDAELVLAGPNVHGVADDPEAPRVFAEVIERWRDLPNAVRDRVHLVNLPTDDIDENAAIVNALQRHAAVVVQKSLQEGFGLTVTEAMWKGRPVMASAVGGIVEQIDDGVHGRLLRDPRDLDEFAEALEQLLRDPELRSRMGTAARERVREQFLGIRHLFDYAALIEQMVA
jgi:trehalose synthase